MIKQALLLLLPFLLPLADSVAQPEEFPPNVVVILADDMGWADMSYTGSAIDTPHLDRLADEGVRLTRFYASAPICSPTRAALLTGRYPHSVGVPGLASSSPRGEVPVLALDHDAVTLPEALKPHGYTSALVGKWHLGYTRPNWPRTHGFDLFWGSLIGTPGYYDVEETYHNEMPIEVDGYFTDRITDKAVEFLEESQGPPFFLYLAYNAPHYPLEASAELVYKYRERFTDEGLYAIYAAMVEQLDHGIGRVLDALDELGLAENTLVVFCADNGPSAEYKSYGLPGARISAGPLRGHKFSTYEGGIRVPFLARWPGRIPAGTARDEVTSTMDLMPTILDALDAPAPDGYAMHGASLWPLLMGEAFASRDTLHWENRHNMAVRRGDWKLVHQFWEERPHLYHLAEDPGEQHDLADQRPGMVLALEAAHAAWKERYAPDPIPRRTNRGYYAFPEK